MKKDAYFFFHDANARNDLKILAMRSVYKSEGYGWYFMLLEIMRESADYKIPLNKYTYHTLAMQMQCDGNALAQYIEDCCTNFRDGKGALLSKDDNFIWSESFIKRMAVIDEKRERNRQSANKRWGNESDLCDDDADAMPAQCDGNAKAIQGKDNIIKNTKRIRKNNKEEDIYSIANAMPTHKKQENNGKLPYGTEKIVMLTSVEYSKLVDRFTQEGADKWVETLALGILSKGYKYKSHYAAILNWERRDNEKKPKAKASNPGHAGLKVQ
ncbi:MAG: Lin1244/Lin1753 domain-containing protein [Candidatus Babeliales bacterium]|jgi:hypothetical protein